MTRAMRSGMLSVGIGAVAATDGAEDSRPAPMEARAATAPMRIAERRERGTRRPAPASIIVLDMEATPVRAAEDIRGPGLRLKAARLVDADWPLSPVSGVGGDGVVGHLRRAQHVDD